MEGLGGFKAVAQDNTSTSAIPSFIEEGISEIAELDPSLELSLDLQELIEKANHQVEEGEEHVGHVGDTTGVDEEQLFPELAVTSEDGKEWNISLTEQEIEEEEQRVKVEAAAPEDIDISNNLLSSQLVDFYNNNNSDNFAASTSTEVLVQIPASKRGRPRTSSTLKAPSPLSNSNRRRRVPRDSDEYRERRDRNNVAVRKSRDKAKQKQQETEDKLSVLSKHNEELQRKVDLLTKELTVLKGLFVNVGAVLPKNLDKLIGI